MRSLTYLTRRHGVPMTAYQLTDHLHDGRMAYVSADGIVSRSRRGWRSWVPAARSSRTLHARCGAATGWLRTRLRIACPLT